MSKLPSIVAVVACSLAITFVAPASTRTEDGELLLP